MNPAKIAKSAKNLLSSVEINVNRLAGRELVPMVQEFLAIETSSVCNLKCVFCAYTKKETPKISMTNAFFADCVAQALDMGYRRFTLTPNTGDVFMDRHIFDKMEHLDAHPGVQDYTFYTNLTIPKPKDVERLMGMKKLQHITVSVYGHDAPSFVAITKSTEKVYRRLLTNLEVLLKFVDPAKRNIDIAVRSTRDMPRTPSTELLVMLDRFRKAGIAVRLSHLYHDWGGQVSAEDVKGLQIDFSDSRKIYKNGACALLFTGMQIMATGVVHACACVDVDAQLEIGNLNAKPLREIISTQNPAYMALIEEQQRGVFKPVCQSCGFYKSIYHNRKLYRQDGIGTQSIDEFKARLDAKTGVAPLPEAAE
jgi:MoaA/NifB/PqqE/SkfB family radical SAM enzyme